MAALYFFVIEERCLETHQFLVQIPQNTPALSIANSRNL